MFDAFFVGLGAFGFAWCFPACACGACLFASLPCGFAAFFAGAWACFVPGFCAFGAPGFAALLDCDADEVDVAANEDPAAEVAVVLVFAVVDVLEAAVVFEPAVVLVDDVVGALVMLDQQLLLAAQGEVPIWA